MFAPTPASQKGWGSFQSPSVELLIHQSDAEYRAPPMPAFVDDFVVPDMLIPRKPENASASASTASSSSSDGDPPTPFGRASCLSSLFLLDASWTFVNHGAFGATLRSMLSVRNAWSERMEAQPLRFLDREVLPLLVQVTREMAQFVGCAPTDLTLHTNATTALNVLFKSFAFSAADKVLRLNLAYGAVKKMIADTGATVVEVDIALPLRSRKQLLDAVIAVLDAPEHQGQWKLAVFDHIASNSAIVHPIEELTRICHARGVPIFVDGAHSLGSVPLSLTASGVDCFVSNCHKWLCNPKGAAIMYVAPKWQRNIKPLIISHGTGAGFSSDFIWTGCQDYAPMLTLLSTLRFWNRLGGLPRAMSYNHSLVMRAGRMLAQRWGTELLVGNGDLADEADAEAHALSANMVCVRLPGPLDPVHSDEHNSIQNALHFDHRIEVPIKVLGSPPRLWMRISAMIYNSMEDYERVATVMWTMRGEANHADGPANSAVADGPSSSAVATVAPAVVAAASSSAPPTVLRPDHTQVCIPPGADALARARDFYCGLLQMKEVARPVEMVDRPGFWLHCGSDTTPPFRANVHIGTESLPADHYLRSKAHIAYSVRNLQGWAQLLRAKGFPVVPGLKIPTMERFDSRDPFGNKVEFIEYDDQPVGASAAEGAHSASSSEASAAAVPYFWHTPRAYSPDSLLRVAVFQGCAVPGDLHANLQTLHAVLQRAQQGGANLVVFPELWLTGYDISKELTHSLALPQDGPVLHQIGDWCRALRVAACFGYPEREASSGSVFNSAAIIGEQGDLLLSYRKTHLWMGGEKAIFTAGNAPSPVVALRPHSVRVGVSICYDCEFPEPLRSLALSGAQLVLIPTALARGQVHETVPLVVVPSRALDNHVWIAYSNLVGRSAPEAKLDFCGLSGIIGPDGVALQRLGDTLAAPADASSTSSAAADLCFHDLLPGDYAQRFETTPLLIDRRPELYQLIAKQTQTQ